MCTIRNQLSKAVINQIKKLDLTTLTEHSLRLRQNLTQADSLKKNPNIQALFYFSFC